MLNVERRDGALIVHLEGELTFANSTATKEEIKSLMEPDVQCFILEASHLQLIDSSGVGVVVSLLKRMNGQGVILVGLQPRVRRVFAITRIDLIVPIYATLDEALMS